MKKHILLLLGVLMLMATMSTKAYAYGNDYLEDQNHYSVYVKSADVIHFKIPVYSRGTWNYYVGCLNNEVSNFYYKWNNTEYSIFEIDADKYGYNNKDDVNYGTVSVKSQLGIVEITNMFNGTRAVVPQDNAFHEHNVTKSKEADNDKDYVTWLEIDWYPPSSLDQQTFTLHAHIKICQSHGEKISYRKEWDFGQYTGADLLMTPQLYDPVFYASKDAEVSGYGCAAVPYVVYQDVKSYHTSFDPKELPASQRADNIFVQTTDTLQTGFKVFFNVYRHKTPTEDLATLTTNAVTIPAYHRIYDFTATEEKDELETFTGRNILRWTIKSPNATDLVEGDYFEVQRALKSDFSDAQTIGSISMGNDGENGVFTHPDDSRDTWSGNAAVQTDTLSRIFTHEVKDYELRDAEGNVLCKTDFTVSANNIQLPSVPVYYRVRRASASMWGWKGHDFAREYKCMKHNFLAPLAKTQANYTVDPESHNVDFRIVLENKDVAQVTVNADSISFDNFSSGSRPYDENHIRYVTITGDDQPIGSLLSSVEVLWYEPGYGTHSEYLTDSTTIALQPDGWLSVSAFNGRYHRDKDILNDPGADDNRDIRLIIRDEWSDEYNRYMVSMREEICPFNRDEKPLFEAVKAHLADSLAQVMSAEIAGSIGKCMWDRSARLVLEKTTDGFTQQIIIPQDSIRRLENGNWEAHFVDAANHACTDYSYAVRIDQSYADLHVNDSVDLQPIALHGPNLYFDEGAAIRTFTASSMDTEGEAKRGIMLRWEPTTNAVDNYILLRRAEEASHADTLYTGLDNSFFDTGVSPEHDYLYTVHVIYDCNGRHTEHYAEATGRRSPYGEIRGQVQMPDYSGMAGVTVALQNSEGQLIRSMLTGGDGTFVFDSLLYDYVAGTEYAIVPTSQYGIFSFNNTSVGTASVLLSQDNCIARDLVFTNSSTVRLSGRALYKGSTIPVSGALFLLNGDTIRRNGAPVKTGIDGTFELTLTQGQPYTLQIAKAGHTFEGNGMLHVEEDEDTFALDKALDGVRFYDETKVRLVGRVAGGNIQRDLPEAFGLGKNNLGANLQLVLQLEGDNTAHFVHDPNDLSRDTVQQTFDHLVYSTDPLSAEPSRTVGSTSMLMEKKRITIRPDLTTGEYEVDLYPVKYKVVQASARGYATLFANGQGSETFDLTNAPLTLISDTLTTNDQGLTTSYNAVYDRIYHTPVQIHLQQMLYGIAQKGYGEASMKVSSFNIRSNEQVPLYTENEDKSITYTLGYPVFYHNRKYQFEAQAYEDYFYNNDHEAGVKDRVPQRGGLITIHNGMASATNHATYHLDSLGTNRNIYLDVTRIETELRGEAALHTVSTALSVEGNTVETEVFRSFVAGDVILSNELHSTDAAITVLDIIRDPGGNGSYAWVESGSSYTYRYKESYDLKFGLNLTPTSGLNLTTDIGTITAAPGTYTGTSMNTSKELAFSFPFVHEIAWDNEYTYNFTTVDKISTSAVKSKQGIGANADVFLGMTTSVLAGKAKSISIINDTLYQQRLPALQSGAMHLLAEGIDSNDKPYYLVIGEKVVLGSYIKNTFAYTQHHILHSVLPRLFIERDNMLEYFADSLTAQQAADQRGEEVYWYIDSLTAAQLQDTLNVNSYKMITPSKSTHVFTDRVGGIETMIKNWFAVIYANEEEKINARYMGQQVGVYSVSAGTSYTHTDSYSAAFNYSHKPQMLTVQSEHAQITSKLATSWLQNIFRGSFASTSTKFFENASTLLQNLKDGNGKAKTGEQTITEIQSRCAGSTFEVKIEPVADIDVDYREGQDVSYTKNVGFTIMPDKQGELTVLDNLGEITVAVYRANADSIWKSQSEPITSEIPSTIPNEDKYGSYVFFTQSGSTYCTFEDADTTIMYNQGTRLSNPTLMLAKPEMSINTYEQANVLPDQKATFKLELRNAGEIPYGWYNGGVYFTLTLYNSSNPNGAKVWVNGAALAQGVEYYLEPGQSIIQTLEVERGDVDDYQDLRLCFQVSDCPKNWTFLDFSVHFLPLSSDVQIDMPRQNWVMNTLSQHDSTGYYIPVEISGFDTHYKNFDHIEFQYKLATESEDMWVNQCSFYAEDSLYEKATGNKAMIENGRIVPFRFYGERDPMEQQYDLRAVSFCRYGSGFVTKTSPVISGTKDTRVPRVFGAAQPADAILGVGNDLKLRFNEPIAGNYLDEDNNFQIVGMTNASGITTGTSLHFDNTNQSIAKTQVERSLTDKSFTIDMMVRPTQSMMPGTFFYTTKKNGDYSVQFGCGEGRLALFLFNEEDVYMFLTEPNVLPSGVFSRVIAVYDNEKKSVQFYIGTQAMPLSTTGRTSLPETFRLSGAAPLAFGSEVEADMLEARIWTKALTPEEISATHMKYLTGYERDLMAYYRMDEGRGNELTDKANGATLYCSGTSWNYRKGISVALKADEELKLDGNLLGRSKIYDESIMLWFKTAAPNGDLFRAGRIENDSVSTGFKLALENGQLVLHSDNNQLQITNDQCADGAWHHVVLTVNRTMNNAAVYVDGALKQSFSATLLGSISGAMYLGGNGFEGNIDDLCFFEQALPKYMVEGFDNLSPAGDEMGLFGYLPFEEMKENDNGVMELVFSPNDQRVFKDANGNMVKKVVPLVIGPQNIDHFADKTNHAPTRDHGQLTKMNFDWSFNNDELLINLNMADREINKQTIYVTVRDVEDLNGNPMASPVSWVAFVDRNALKWSQRTLRVSAEYDHPEDINASIDIINTSGRRHQYTIESIPDWLTVSTPYGTMSALEELQVRLTFDADLPVGVYNDQIYLTDEDGLAEPLNIEYTVQANPPYDAIDHNAYPLNMSLCGQVMITKTNEVVYDTDERDIVYAMYKDECVGMANITFDEQANKSKLFLTVYGSDAMTDKAIRFQLWQASTGKVYDLSADRTITFKHGNVYGCGDGNPVVLTTNGSERQTINLQPGWNWTSFNLDLRQYVAKIANIMTANDPWTEGDIIKNPATQHFVIYSDSLERFAGDFDYLRYIYTYMIYCKHGNTMHISGNNLPADSMYVPVFGGGKWSPMPCLLKQVTPVAEALADYYDRAMPGDMLKSHDHFAYFSEDKKWEGDLTAMRPGEGYLFRRLASDTVNIRFFNKPQNSRMNRMNQNNPSGFNNPKAATNMTMIAKVEGLTISDYRLEVFVNDELAGVAEPMDSLYFITIQSDKVGELRFEIEGETLIPSYINGTSYICPSYIEYHSDTHHGTIKAPVLLKKAEETGAYKIIENDHVVIIQNNEKYDVTGKKL